MSSFSDLDTLRQMGLVSIIYNDNHQLCLKFSCAGTGITFNGSMDSALIISATKQQMTVDNIGLQGIIGPMGGMMTGYVPPAIDELEIIVGIRWDPSNQKWLAKTFSGASDWWWCGVLNQSDISDLTELGVGIVTKSDVTTQWNGQIGAIEFNPEFDYSIEAMYSDLGQTQVIFNRDEFFIISKASGNSGNYDNSCLIHSLYATSTSVMAYKLKIKRGGNQNSCLYLQSDLLSMAESQWYSLYKMTGLPVEFTTQPSSVLGYFETANEYDSLHLIPSGFTIEFRNNNNYLEVRQTNSLSQALSAAKIVVVWTSTTPALPTVSMSGDFGDANWLYASLDGSNKYVSAGSSIMVGIEVSGRPYPVSYDTSKQYAVIRWSTFQSSQGSGHTEYAIINNSGQIYAKNVTSGDLYLYATRVAVCSDSSATVVTVYDSSNNPYNAFKYTSDGTDYYYVLDGVQTDWTDDLESIGYSLFPAPALPTVSMNGDFGDDNYVMLDSMGQTIRLNAGSSAYARKNGIVPYDETKSYGVIEFNRDGAKAGAIEVSVINGNGSMMIKNVSSSSILIQNARIAVCSSLDATVITVYDSSNNPYNAFQYTSDGTDYYYVLDGVQTDWTDDLASIGYKLPTIGYLSSDKTAKSMNAGGLDTLYDENGTKMTVSTYGVSYPAVRVYSSSSDTTGTAVVNNNWTVHGPQFSSGDLSVSNLTGSTQTIQRIAFIK